VLTIRFYVPKLSLSLITVSVNGCVAFADIFVCSMLEMGGDLTPMSNAAVLDSTVFNRKRGSLANY